MQGCAPKIREKNLRDVTPVVGSLLTPCLLTSGLEQKESSSVRMQSMQKIMSPGIGTTGYDSITIMVPFYNVRALTSFCLMTAAQNWIHVHFSLFM